MGKGDIKENKGNGLYLLKVDFQRKRSDEKVKQIDLMIAQLNSEIDSEEDELKKTAKRSQIASLELEKIQEEDIRNVTIEAWCADLTENLSGEVATAEIPNELGALNIMPGFTDAAVFDIEINGQLQPAISSKPYANFYNQSLKPWSQKFKPLYRHGIATDIDKVNHTCYVTLEEAISTWQNFDVNQTGALANVPIKYMDCDSYAFDENDPVLVRFIDQDWLTPEVIGFKNNPKPCYRKIRVKFIYDFDNSIIPLPAALGFSFEFNLSVSWRIPNGEIRGQTADLENTVQVGDYWEMTLDESFDGHKVGDYVWITLDIRKFANPESQNYYSVPSVQYPFNYKNGTFKQDKDLIPIDNEYEIHVPYWHWTGFSYTNPDAADKPIIWGDPLLGPEFFLEWGRDYPVGTIWPNVTDQSLGVENQNNGYSLKLLFQAITKLKWLLGSTIPFKSQFIIQDLSWGYEASFLDEHGDRVGGYFFAKDVGGNRSSFPDLEGVKVEVEETNFSLNISVNTGSLLNETTDWKEGSTVGSSAEYVDNPPIVKVTPLYVEGREGVPEGNANAFADFLISSNWNGQNNQNNVLESITAGVFWDENQVMLDLINAERAKV